MNCDIISPRFAIATHSIRPLDIGLGAAAQSHAQTEAKNAARVSGAGMMGGERRHEKENLADFIAKKREMFLVQMSLDTKKTEIQKYNYNLVH